MANSDKTNNFIKKYCIPEKQMRKTIGDSRVITDMWNTLESEYGEVDKLIIKHSLNNIDYSSYLTTYWWYIIRHKRRLMDGFNCMIDANHEDYLVTHHNTYMHRGAEIGYMWSIITFCYKYHNKIHNKIERDTIVPLYNLSANVNNLNDNQWTKLEDNMDNVVDMARCVKKIWIQS